MNRQEIPIGQRTTCSTLFLFITFIFHSYMGTHGFPTKIVQTYEFLKPNLTLCEQQEKPHVAEKEKIEQESALIPSA